MNGAIKIEARMSKTPQSGLSVYLSFDLNVYQYRKNDIKDFPDLLLKVMKLSKNKVAYLPVTVWRQDIRKWVETGSEIYVERKGNHFEKVVEVVLAGQRQVLYPNLESAIEEHFDKNIDFAELMGRKKEEVK